MSRNIASIRAARRRGGWGLLAAAALASLSSACGQLPGSPDQPAVTRPARTAAVAPSGPVGKAPSETSAVKHADLIGGVSCVGRGCTAVGDYYYGTDSSSTLVERWNGASWQLEPAPNTVRYSSLSAVSCAASTDCVAVGAPVLTWRGKAWQVSARSSPFTSVSCVTTRLCLAVGATDNGQPVYGIWRGRAWRIARLPGPRRSQTRQITIAGVSCETAHFCLVVGGYATGVTAMPNPAYRDRTLAVEWDGRNWHPLRPANVSRADAFSAVSCASPVACTAVGTTLDQYPLAEHWNGTSWRIERLPLPGKIGYTQLSAVSCGSATVCVAVGNYQGRPVAEVGHGRTWRLQWLPHLGGDDNPLEAVSCTTAASCMAVGISPAESYAERWNGTHWQLVSMLNPR